MSFVSFILIELYWFHLNFQIVLPIRENENSCVESFEFLYYKMPKGYHAESLSRHFHYFTIKKHDSFPFLFNSLRIQEERAEEYLEKYSKCNFERQQFRDKNESLELQLSNAMEARYDYCILVYLFVAIYLFLFLCTSLMMFVQWQSWTLILYYKQSYFILSNLLPSDLN